MAFFTVNLLKFLVPVGRNEVLVVVVSLELAPADFSVVVLVLPMMLFPAKPKLGEITSFDSVVLF